MSIHLIELVRSIFAGLFGSLKYWPPALLSVAVVILAFRMKVDDIPKLIMPIAKIFEKDSTVFLGWGVAFAILILAAIIVNIILRFYRGEISRIAGERDALQERLINQPVQHSQS